MSNAAAATLPKPEQVFTSKTSAQVAIVAHTFNDDDSGHEVQMVSYSLTDRARRSPCPCVVPLAMFLSIFESEQAQQN